MPSVDFAVQAALDGFRDYLLSKVPGLSVQTEWPEANQQLKYPTATLFSGDVKLMNLAPYQVSASAPDSKGMITVVEVVGEYDFLLQVDLWCATKVQRAQTVAAVKNAINAQGANGWGNVPAGLSLQLSNYYNDFVRFDMDGVQYVDDEASAQRRERRAKIRLLVNCRDLRQRQIPQMKQIVIYQEVTPQAIGDGTAGTQRIPLG